VALILIARAAHANDLEAVATAVPACEASRTHCLPIQLHVAADAAGLVVTPEWIAHQLAVANRHFGSLDVAFQLAGTDTLDDSAVHIETRADRNALAARGLPGRVIHLFIVRRLDDIDVKGGILNGVAWRRPGDKRKYVILASNAFERTLAHELGHVFGLPHSSYAVSIMNKTERKEPPVDQRTFADEEIAAMRTALGRLVRDKFVVPLAGRSAAPLKQD
jgi:hypothetical protein